MPINEETDALIIGAGPIGLFQAFELGLLGVRCQIVEALDKPGGQCHELYPDKPIYDIPGTAYTTASHFVEQLLEQIKPFNIPVHYQHHVQQLKTCDNGFMATTSNGNTFTAKHVVLATGAGAFTPVKLRTDGINDYDSQVHYGDIEKLSITNKNIVVIGDNQVAIDAAIAASTHAKHVVFVHQKRRLDANTDAIQQLNKAVARGNLRQLKGKVTGFTADNTLRSIDVRENSESTVTIDTDHILVRLGNSPKQSELDTWGIDTSARHVPVDTAEFQTNTTGIYAVGDINTYPAKRKLILCGFHEATLAAFAIASGMQPDKPLHLQYTTTSTELQKRLGVL